jgi:import inner membrane translocase subunit TIM22
MPAGTTPQEREEFRQMMKWQGWMNGAMESCPLKTVLSGGAGKSSAEVACAICND